ncbi:MAG: MotA/TolQ/ExbB proton channel family protein [Verrucomicrobiales bacterium]|jgi:biopolymer transport protein ExbB/TolQ|nr:MotA/TolQ/ExbB proton channel family protein [Verrucomicrobiales bacterium]
MPKKTLIISGIITIIAPMFGMTGTVIGMLQAFGTLGQPGVANMNGLSAAISGVLVSTVAGLVIGGVSFIVFIVTLVCWLLNRKLSSSASTPKQFAEKKDNPTIQNST